MTIGIEISTHNNRLLSEILGKSSHSFGDTITISENAILEYRGSILRKTEIHIN